MARSAALLIRPTRARAASPGAVRAYVDQSLRGDRAGPICMASRNHREILSHRGLDLVPFLRQLARGDRLGFHTEQLSGLLIIARRRLGRRGRHDITQP